MNVYHEQQESRLCGQHCLNNLLQGPHFTAINLAEIANELDTQERNIINNDFIPTESANVDDSGNFSIQVLRRALQRYNNIDLEPWFQQSGREDVDPLEQIGFVVNLSDHWFTIRKINDNWWNLNSTNPKPVLISQFFLSAFLHGLRAEGYSVFIATGNVPTHGDLSLFGDFMPQGSGTWYEESALLAEAEVARSKGGGSSSAAPAPFSGVGHRLGGDRKEEADADTEAMLAQSDMTAEDLMLAKAISASLEGAGGGGGGGRGQQVSTIQGGVSRTESSSAADLRARRLAALEKRGL